MKLTIVVLFFLITSLTPLSSSQTIDKAKIIDQYLFQSAERKLFSGTVLVARGDSILYHKGFGYANEEWEIPNGPEVKYKICSITKQFTTLMIFQLIDEGLLSFDDPISKYIPEYRKDIGDLITVDLLLQHRSGIPSYTTELFWTESSHRKYSHPEFIKRFLTGDLEFEPKTIYRYSNTNTFLLGIILERVTGDSFEDNLNNRLLKPLEMTSTGIDDWEKVITNRAENYVLRLNRILNEPFIDMSNAFATGELYSTSLDLFKWRKAFKTGVILSDSLLSKLYEPYYRINKFYGMAYAWNIYTMRLRETRDIVWLHDYNGLLNGAYATLTRVPEDDYTIIILSNHGKTMVTSDEIINILYDNPYVAPHPPTEDALGYIAAEHGIDSVLTLYRYIKTEDTLFFKRRMEMVLNELGYDLLRARQVDDALTVFKLNVDDHPRSANAWDSYAEAFAVKGDTLSAIKYYRKSLDWNNNNSNAKIMIGRLKGN